VRQLEHSARKEWDGKDWPEIWQARLEGDLDLGSNRTATKILYGPDSVWVGIVESHPHPDGHPAHRCSGYCLFAVPAADEYASHYVGGSPTRWQVSSFEPLTMAPSIACKACPNHGFIHAGRWIPA
jgi:hypothetical protein